MRIVHYMQEIDFTRGGPPRAVVDQVATMFGRGHDAGLMTTDATDVPVTWTDPANVGSTPRVELLPAVRGFFGRFGRVGLDRLATAIRDYDVVHVHGVWEPANLQVAAICRRVGVPYVVSLRGMLDDWSMDQSALRKRIYLRAGGRRYLESAAAVHCTADAELEQSRKWFPRGNGVVVPNLIDLDPYADVPDPAAAIEKWPVLGEAGFHVLFLSRIQVKKGIEHLIDAVAQLRERGTHVNLFVAGSGDEDYVDAMRDRVRSAGLEDRFIWTGHVGGDLKNSLYSACDVFALPTSQENFGFVFFESLASATPVITTDLVDTRFEIERSGGGVIIPQTGNAFAEAIESFARGDRDGGAMGRSGRTWTLENLDTARVAGAFETVYESCISG
jgi:glycosyltransferase involved in cell wall biosynthesis